MLATPAREVPLGPQTQMGRLPCRRSHRGHRRQAVRRGRPHHDRFPRLNAEPCELPAGTVLDGELVCLEPSDGGRVRYRFDRLSGCMVGRVPHQPSHGLTVQLIAFDVVSAEGVDLRIRPWSARRDTLERLLAGADGALRLTPVIAGDQALHDALIADGWEGTVAKRAEAATCVVAARERG
jgi:ATP-dependent DNA ligase